MPPLLDRTGELTCGIVFSSWTSLWGAPHPSGCFSLDFGFESKNLAMSVECNGIPEFPCPLCHQEVGSYQSRLDLVEQ